MDSDPATAIAGARDVCSWTVCTGRSRHSGLGWWAAPSHEPSPRSADSTSSDGHVGQKSFGLARPERDRIRDEGLADICLETLSSAKTLDSEATAGIEPAMKVLQTSR